MIGMSKRVACIVAVLAVVGCGGVEPREGYYGSIECSSVDDCSEGELCIKPDDGQAAIGVCLMQCDDLGRNATVCDIHPGTDCTHVLWSRDPTWNVCVVVDQS
jgi:hypothetical protein